MNAVMQINARPIFRPAYLNTTSVLRSLATWVEANRVALVDYFEQLRDADQDGDGCTFTEFCYVQFDAARDLHDKLLSDRGVTGAAL